eukprot:g64973.t1
MLKAYVSLLQKRPYSTKSASAAVLFGLGDLLAQANGHEPYSPERAARFVAYAALLYAPTQHLFFAWMERSVATGMWWASHPTSQVAARVGVHVTVYAPFSIVTLFGWMTWTQGHSDTATVLEKCSTKHVVPTWAAGASFWVPAMMGIYRFVPLHSRVVATSACNVAWCWYLSVMIKSNSARDIKSKNDISSTQRSVS